MNIWGSRLKIPWVGKTVGSDFLLSSHTSYHHHDINEILLLWCTTNLVASSRQYWEYCNGFFGCWCWIHGWLYPGVSIYSWPITRVLAVYGVWYNDGFMLGTWPIPPLTLPRSDQTLDQQFEWCARLKIPWAGKSVGAGFILLISYIISLPWYHRSTIAMA